MNYDWDGHTLALHIDSMEIGATTVCPHDDAALAELPWGKQPRCRTEPREPGVPWPDCSVARGWKDAGTDAIETMGRFDVTAVPVRIGWCWDSEDGLYVWPIATPDETASAVTA
jgi:hypothetical protein